MIRIKLLVIFYITFSLNVSGQGLTGDSISLIEYYENVFSDTKNATANHVELWDKDLYGPILLVDPITRYVYANYPDENGLLNRDGKIYTGNLPETVNIANTSVNWSGRNWAMIILPLSDNHHDRINLITHELFHVAQPNLGFQLFNVDNNHLDEKDGRIYMRLELQALKKAIISQSENERHMHLTNAFIFRKYRYSIYPSADSTENLLELNEGIAEYTGVVISKRNNEEIIQHFNRSINDFNSNLTFVRSFAYHTIPVYGYLLRNVNEYWNKEISVETNLTDYFIKAFDLDITADLQKSVELISDRYISNLVIAEETARDEARRELIAEYKKKFIEEPHFEIFFEQMNISFDPRNIMPLEDKGTVYPNIRVTDNWGILSVENGALLSPNWNKITLTVPTKIEENLIIGNGWMLELNEGYKIIVDSESGNYKLQK